MGSEAKCALIIGEGGQIMQLVHKLDDVFESVLGSVFLRLALALLIHGLISTLLL